MAAVAALLSVACGGSGEPTTTPPEPTAEPSEATTEGTSTEATDDFVLPPDPSELTQEEKIALLREDRGALKRMRKERRVAERLALLPPELRDPDRPLPPWDFSGIEIPETPPTAPVPTVAVDADTTGHRCSERQRLHLVVERGGERIRDGLAKDELKGADSVVVERGRHADERGLPLVALIGDAASVEIVPCSGEPLVLEGDSVRQAPDKWMLVLGGRDIVKLLDMTTDPDPRKPQLRNLAVIRLR